MENDVNKLRSIDCTLDTLRRDSHYDDLPENKEDLTLIWLDETINDSSYCQQMRHTLRQYNDYILEYTDPLLCINYISRVAHEKIFLILSNKLAQTILSDFHVLDTIHSIFIFSMNSTRFDIDYKQHSKVVGIFTDKNLLMKSIQTRAHYVSKQTMGFAFIDGNGQNSIRDLERDLASFVLFHKLLRALKDLPQTSQAKQQMINEWKDYYRTNTFVLNKINEFEETYQSSDAIRWYTADCFLYKLLNKALRTEDVSQLHSFRYYIIDLCKQIEHESEYYLASLPQTHDLQLYRGQVMPKQEIENLRNSVGNLISPNGFFSTSEDLQVALMFIGDDQSKKVLFEIIIDRKIVKARSVIFAAAVQRFSHFADEKEVVFSIGVTFMLKSVIYDSHLKIWRVQMMATDQRSEYIHTYIDLMYDVLEESTPTAYFGELLIDMGQYSKAEEYHQFYIKTLPQDCLDIPLLYHGLGYIYYKRRQYDKALKYGTIGHMKLKEQLPADHLLFAQSYVNLGWDYKRSGRPDRALDLFQKALAIRERKHEGKDHTNIAIVLMSIGDTYTDLNDYHNGFDYLIKGLQAFQRILPPEHVEISKTLIKIGNHFAKQSLLDLAMVYYCRGYTMARKTMPIEHPNVKSYVENISRLYKKMTNINEDIALSDENIVLQCETLSGIRQHIIRIRLLKRNIINDAERKLIKDYQTFARLNKVVCN